MKLELPVRSNTMGFQPLLLEKANVEGEPQRDFGKNFALSMMNSFLAIMILRTLSLNKFMLHLCVIKVDLMYSHLPTALSEMMIGLNPQSLEDRFAQPHATSFYKTSLLAYLEYKKFMLNLAY